MKAIVLKKFGSLDILKLEEIPKPIPGDDEVLVKVYASCVNYNILVQVSGKPLMARLMGIGVLKPKFNIPGSDIVGKIEALRYYSQGHVRGKVVITI